MTAFKTQGYKLSVSDLDEVMHLAPASLEVISRIGINTLEATYIGNPKWPYAVELSDYNLNVNGAHFSVLEPPDRIDLFDLVNADGAITRVLSLVFEDSEARDELIFAVAGSALPDLATPGDTALFLAGCAPIASSSAETVSIQLTQLPNVEMTGVLSERPNPVTEIEQTAFQFTAAEDIIEPGMADWLDVEADLLAGQDKAAPAKAPPDYGVPSDLEAPVPPADGDIPGV